MPDIKNGVPRPNNSNTSQNRTVRNVPSGNTAGRRTVNLSGRNNAKRNRAQQYRLFAVRVAVVIILSAVMLTVYGIGLFINLHSYTKDPGAVTVLRANPAPTVLQTETSALVEQPVITYDFIEDLSEYEPYMNPSDDEDFLRLINYENLLDESYKPDDLMDVPTRGDRAVQQLRENAAMSLMAFLKEAAANGITDVTVTSGWRSYNTQVYLLNNQVAKYTGSMNYEDAYALAITEVAIPGTSEHQSGLCVDMHNLPGADISFAESKSAQWLADNCYKFGFILRYPEDKTDITRISFEPWHFRYVGRWHATIIHELGYCLEEYIEWLQS